MFFENVSDRWGSKHECAGTREGDTLFRPVSNRNDVEPAAAATIVNDATHPCFVPPIPPTPLSLRSFFSIAFRLVKYSNPNETEAAVAELNNTMLHERRLTVRLDRK